MNELDLFKPTTVPLVLTVELGRVAKHFDLDTELETLKREYVSLIDGVLAKMGADKHLKDGNLSNMASAYVDRMASGGVSVMLVRLAFDTPITLGYQIIGLVHERLEQLQAQDSVWKGREFALMVGFDYFRPKGEDTRDGETLQ